MIKTSLLLLFATSSFGIIVRDPPGIQYRYSYNVQDPTTGDNKSQEESRDGDVVTGSYTVHDPDGSKRVVKYTADPRNGFKATVETKPYSEPYMTDPVNDNAPFLYTAIISDNFVPSYHQPKQYVGPRQTYFTPESLIRKHNARNQYYSSTQYL